MTKDNPETTKKKIIIFCQRCKKTMTVDRQEEDPQEASKAIIDCDECSHGGFSVTRYVDKNGREINVDP